MQRWAIPLGALLIAVGSADAQMPPRVVADGNTAPIDPEFPPPAQPVANGAWSNERIFWLNADYLFAWMQGPRLPVLVTTSPDGTDKSSAGVRGTDGVSSLFGGKLPNDGRAGLRLESGWWFDSERGWGLDVGFM